MNSLVANCKKIAESSWFKNVITLVIIIAGVLVGIQTYHAYAERNQEILEVLDTVILWIFVLEIVIKLVAEGRKPWNYFTNGWNVFDFIIVAAAFLPFGGSSITILRLLRLLRVLKLISALPKLQMLVSALLKSIPSMGYVSLLLLILFYIYAVIGVFFFGTNDPIHFGDLETSMLSLFRVVTLEDWTDVMYINMFGCENYGYDGAIKPCMDSVAQPALSIAYFVSFVLIGTMIMLNLFIGIIMNGMDEAKAEMEMEASEERKGSVSVADLETKLHEMQVLINRLAQAEQQQK
ncbi:MAG TPA: potassium transporter [Cytophagales bacterium]|nr:potassium transporter [Cytophagales bacterium]HAA21472.1 potassium transporter [Cytophagales bacterium]HAP65222.1 potassium transporter [Cytophagales bacterium]